jgi:hypothetical protein
MRSIIKTWIKGCRGEDNVMIRKGIRQAIDHYPRESLYSVLVAVALTWIAIALLRRVRGYPQTLARPRTPDVEKPPRSPIGEGSKSKFAMEQAGGEADAYISKNPAAQY